MANAALIIYTRRGALGRRAPADDRSAAADGRPRRRIRGEAGSGGGGGGRRVRQMTSGWLEMARGTGRGRAEHLLRATQSTARKKKKSERKNELTKERKKERKGKEKQRFYRKYVQSQIQTDKKTPFKILAPLRDRSPFARTHAVSPRQTLLNDSSSVGGR